MSGPEPPSIQSSQPSLSPQFCFDTTTLRDFLRLSRSTLDDSISAHLNSLLTPSRAGFSPSSTSIRLPRPTSSHAQLSEQACTVFKADVLFPSWQARENVIRYCSRVAATPDPSAISAPAPFAAPTSAAGAYADADAAASTTASLQQQEPTPQRRTSLSQDPTLSAPQEPARQPTGPSDLWQTPPPPLMSSSSGGSSSGNVSRNYWGREQVVDERTDPYSARDYSYTREGRQQVLADVLRNEEGVERIVRSRTWGVLCERCIGGRGSDDGWKAEFEKWKS